MLLESKGSLRYSQSDDGYKLIVEVDPGIVSLYRDLVPKYYILNKQAYDPHISVIRNEIPSNLEFWGRHEGEEVVFSYDNTIQHGMVYWWLNVFSDRLEKIRLELGLPVASEYTLPPEGFIKCFHCTIGNSKNC